MVEALEEVHEGDVYRSLRTERRYLLVERLHGIYADVVVMDSGCRRDCYTRLQLLGWIVERRIVIEPDTTVRKTIEVAAKVIRMTDELNSMIEKL